MNPSTSIQTFTQLGGTFCCPEEELLERLSKIKAFVFDWDGVFNSGIKSQAQPSSFSEPDSMGQNMLRFAYWLQHQKQLPYTAIITGANNPTAQWFAQREHLHALYMGYPHKQIAIQHFAEQHQLKTEEIAFVFDDILDLSAVKLCGLRILIKRTANPLFNNFVLENKLCEYITAHTGGNHAIRELSELLIGLYGNFETVIQERIIFDQQYKKYLTARNKVAYVLRKI